MKQNQFTAYTGNLKKQYLGARFELKSLHITICYKTVFLEHKHKLYFVLFSFTI